MSSGSEIRKSDFDFVCLAVMRVLTAFLGFPQDFERVVNKRYDSAFGVDA